MPWLETGAVNERMKFVVDYQRGLPMTVLCRRHRVSRKTGYKWVRRFKQDGAEGLQDRSRRPRSCSHAVAAQTVALLVDAKKHHPYWGPKKLVAWLAERHPEERLPAASTAGEWLKKYGLVRSRKRLHRVPPYTEPFAAVNEPNDLWCADFKGDFKTGDDVPCHPLTITDADSRLVLQCRSLVKTKFVDVKPWFEEAFNEYGLPLAMRSDNGPPFATKAVRGLSRLSIWWLKLGIHHERIEPGHPEQNGRHERMHETLKAEATRPPAANATKQQAVFDVWRQEYNVERPHEALGMKAPATRYKASLRTMPRTLPEFTYPADYSVRKVADTGRFRWPGRHLILVGAPLAGECVGCHQIDDEVWEVFLGSLLLGFIDITRIEAGLLRV